MGGWWVSWAVTLGILTEESVDVVFSHFRANLRGCWGVEARGGVGEGGFWDWGMGDVVSNEMG